MTVGSLGEAGVGMCTEGCWPEEPWCHQVLWLPGSHCRPVPGLCSAADVERSLGQADSGWDQEASCPPTEGDRLHLPLLSDWASLAARLPGPVAAAQGGPASVDSRCPEPWGGDSTVLGSTCGGPRSFPKPWAQELQLLDAQPGSSGCPKGEGTEAAAQHSAGSSKACGHVQKPGWVRWGARDSR